MNKVGSSRKYFFFSLNFEKIKRRCFRNPHLFTLPNISKKFVLIQERRPISFYLGRTRFEAGRIFLLENINNELFL